MSEDRLVELEMRYTHLNKTVEDLSDVVLQQAQRIDQLERQLQRLGHRTETLEQHLEEPRDPLDEKPPHY